MRRTLYLCLTEICPVLKFWNSTGQCRVCGERGFPADRWLPWWHDNGKPG